jgi:hypothetical protein
MFQGGGYCLISDGYEAVQALAIKDVLAGQSWQIRGRERCRESGLATHGIASVAIADEEI